MTKKEFAESFAKTMKGQLSTAEFARQAIDYMKSPDYNRWKAVQGALDLKRWREGREHLMSLIMEEKKLGTNIDYEIVTLKDGHDSVCILLNEHRTVCFPSFFGKESVDENWESFLETKKKLRPCGNHDCSVSTSVDDITLTFGRGDLDEWGYWSIPCVICAIAWTKHTPKDLVWPVADAPK